MSTGPTDWVSGERVFAPPSGTLDVDWLVPAVLDAVPSGDPARARAALAAAWAAVRAGEPVPAGDPTTDAAARVLDEAGVLFRAGPPAPPVP
jgi:hypothetical protein